MVGVLVFFNFSLSLIENSPIGASCAFLFPRFASFCFQRMFLPPGMVFLCGVEFRFPPPLPCIISTPDLKYVVGV